MEAIKNFFAERAERKNIRARVKEARKLQNKAVWVKSKGSPKSVWAVLFGAGEGGILIIYPREANGSKRGDNIPWSQVESLEPVSKD